MPHIRDVLETEFRFGNTSVHILEGDILQPGVDIDAVVSTDDNYLTMGSGVSRTLAELAGPEYVRAAQLLCPVQAGTVVDTQAFQLPDRGLDVKVVLHAAVIDYDTSDLPLDEIVHQVTANCLKKAEKLGLESILLPAFATGAGGLSRENCARRMCSAIKDYLALHRPLKAITLILHLPPEDTVEPAVLADKKARNQRFIREANLVLGVPYDPVATRRQLWDFYGRENEMQQLEAVITGAKQDKRHAAILGGPRVGKSALLDQLLYRAQQPGNRLGEGRRIARVTFGRVHENTPKSFIYRKLLCSLRESDPGLMEQAEWVHADAEMDCGRFLSLLAQQSDRYREVVFLVDHLPRLLRMGAKDFWRDLDRLESRARFVFTAADDDQYKALRDHLSADLKAGLEEVRLACMSEQERREWIEALYRRYLHRSATEAEFSFLEKEAGRHPHLISLACYALIEALKRDLLTNPTHLEAYNQDTLAPFFQAARNMMEGPRRDFFDVLMGPSLHEKERFDLKNLAKAVTIEKRLPLLMHDLADPDISAEYRRLIQRQAESRQSLHDDRLRKLEAQGYIVDAANPDQAQFMAQSFATYAAEFFEVSQREDEDDLPRDVVISLLSPTPQVINTLFRGHGARIVTAQKEFLPEIKADFIESFGRHISHQLYPVQHPEPGPFQDIKQAANYILTQFTTSAIKRYLQNPPPGSTILLVIQDELKDIPWELMLETAYTDEIPFRVGRSIASPQQPSGVNPPVRGVGKIKALLIGDPMDDLDEARHEVEDLANRLRQHDRFDEPDVLIGSEECQRATLLSALGSRGYGLIHYSGHSRFDGYRSAWQLANGEKITTNVLTNSLQMAPPAFVFSSSCESGQGGEGQSVKYEDQTFDLPSAFLQAGVEAYVGTLWQVDASEARQFVKAFYRAFLSGEYNLGECLRQAKWARKHGGDRINWQAFILYGDPHTKPGDLFPALDGQED